MRRYEVTCILAPTLSTDEVEQTIETYRSVAEEQGAEVVKVDSWGKRRLAFPVKKHIEGYYVIFTLDEAAAQAAAELERRFKVSDPVIRFLTVRVDEDLSRAEKFKANREAKKARRKADAAKAKAKPPAKKPSAPADEESQAPEPAEVEGKASDEAKEPKASRKQPSAKPPKAAVPDEAEDEEAGKAKDEKPATGDKASEITEGGEE